MAGITYWEVGQSRKLNKDIHNSTGPRFGALPNAATSTLIGPLVSLAPQFTLLLEAAHLEKLWTGFGAVQLWNSERCHTVQTCRGVPLTHLCHLKKAS
ncbi:hypothetical protein E4U61_000258 [Claviceps capensis]|nr:hypothetical protein E4U61_000258 [Claviceps capensis]